VRLSIEFDSLEFFSLPLSSHHAGVRLRNVAGQRNHQREGVFRSGNGVAARGVHDNDPAAGGRRHVDIVHAHPGPSDRLQTRSQPNDIGGNPGLRAHDDAIVGVCRPPQFVLLDANPHLDLEVWVGLKFLDADL
jgi:hypothetical protein